MTFDLTLNSHVTSIFSSLKCFGCVLRRAFECRLSRLSRSNVSRNSKGRDEPPPPPPCTRWCASIPGGDRLTLPLNCVHCIDPKIRKKYSVDIFIFRILSAFHNRIENMRSWCYISFHVLIAPLRYTSYVLCILSCILLMCYFETGRVTVWKVFYILIINILSNWKGWEAVKKRFWQITIVCVYFNRHYNTHYTMHIA